METSSETVFMRNDMVLKRLSDDASDDSEELETMHPSSPKKKAQTLPTLAAVPSIVGITFTTWAEFFSFWDKFGREILVMYQTRDCQNRCHNHVNTGVLYTALKCCQCLTHSVKPTLRTELNKL
ncbi:hypothetical protein F442_12424 [Phytophthora nicotianae P10297]|uniref:Uncharacterized protein n=1 Tax=Phytophthora nicotianae P10297 TaxID=1317064 RepID=W2Z1Y8_PHYNI|nr:hypothetical protein F442_12424 [Phytophthora nicotianae P10297]